MVARLASLLVLVVASACDPADDGITSFGERTFLSESVEGQTLVPGTRLTMNFDGRGGMGAWAGCNSISTDAYHLSDGRLVTGDLFATELGCDDALYEQDQWLASFLHASPSYELDEPRLILSDDSVTIVLLDREVADPDRSLQGRTWEVDGLISNGFVGFAVATPDATLEFGDESALAIVTPCAPGSATYEVGLSSLALSSVTIGDVACPDDEFAVRYDEHMREVLVDGTFDYEIDANHMELMRGDIGLWLSTD
jgi:heat shock protein HslJ